MECSRARVSTGKPDRRLLKEPREREVVVRLENGGCEGCLGKRIDRK